MQLLGMCYGSHSKQGPDLPCFFLLLLPDAVPELVACPSSLTSKPCRLFRRAVGAGPVPPSCLPTAPGSSFARGCSAGEELHLCPCEPCSQRVQLSLGEGGRCAGWPTGAGEVCKDKTEGCLGVKGKAKTKMGCASGCSVAL